MDKIFTNNIGLYPDFIESTDYFMELDYDKFEDFSGLSGRHDLRMILEEYGHLSVNKFFDIKRLHSPWLVVFFNEEKDILGHLLELEMESRGKFKFGPLSDDVFRDYLFKIPKIGFIAIETKDDCFQLTQNSSLFSRIWDNMEYCDKDSHWIHILENLPTDMMDFPKSKNVELWNRFANYSQKLLLN